MNVLGLRERARGKLRWGSVGSRTPAGQRWLNAPLTPAQTQTLHLAAETFRATGEWPKWSSLRRKIGLGATAGQHMLQSMPQVGGSFPLAQSYGFLWTERLNVSLPDDAPVALTVAGLWRAGAGVLVEGYLDVLHAAVEASRGLDLSLTGSAVARFTSSHAAALGQPASAFAAASMYDLLSREPPFWAARNRSPSDDEGSWSFGLSDDVERYAPAATIEAYAALVSAQIEEANAQSGAPGFGSPPPQPAGPRWKTVPIRGLAFIGQRSQIVLTNMVDRVLFVLFGAAGVIVLSWLGWAPWLKHLHC